MDMKQIVSAAAEIKGGQKQLAEYLGLHQQSLTDAKAGRRGLPNHALIKLSEMTGIELKAVLAASELTTAKDEKVRSFLLPFVQSGRLAHHLTIAAIAPAMIAIMQGANDFISQSSSFWL